MLHERIDIDDYVFELPGNRLRAVDNLHKPKTKEAKPATITVIFSSEQKIEVPVKNVGGKRIQLTDKIDL